MSLGQSKRYVRKRVKDKDSDTLYGERERDRKTGRLKDSKIKKNRETHKSLVFHVDTAMQCIKSVVVKNTLYLFIFKSLSPWLLLCYSLILNDGFVECCSDSLSYSDSLIWLNL